MAAKGASKLKPVIGAILIAAVIGVVVWVSAWGSRAPGSEAPERNALPSGPAVVQPAAPGTAAPDAAEDDDGGAAAIAQLFETQRSEVQVQGFGWVQRTLSDDVDGDRHQRFILELTNGMTILFAHNIDGFPRLDGLAAGDRVDFNGEYVWTEQGGTIHWTHRADGGSHPDGWLEWDGRRYW